MANVAVVAMNPKYLNGSSQAIHANATTSASVRASTGADRGPRGPEARVGRGEHARSAALPRHREERARGEVDPGQRRHQGADRHAEINEHASHVPA